MMAISQRRPTARGLLIYCLLPFSMTLQADSALVGHVEMLASDSLGGRLTGSEGAQTASQYLAEQLKALGGTPLPGQDGFMLPFEFTAGSRDTGSELTIASETMYGEGDVQALSFSDAGAVSGEVVFAGYGLRTADGTYDSYATIDVKDKIVLVLRYFPEDADNELRANLARYSGLRYKAMQARQNGAKGLLVVTGPNSPNAGELVPMKFDTAISGSGLIAASISADAARTLLARVDDQSLESAQTALDSGNPHVAGFPIPDTQISLSVKIERERKTGRNVGAMFSPLFSRTNAELQKPWVIIGAHFDHLGRGDGGNSLARGEEVGQVHHGADDNASGVAAVLEAVRQLRELGHQRNLAVLFWSGEELGLLGASSFVENPPVALEDVAAYINLDMVGRVRENRLSAQAVGSSEAWTGTLERANVPVGFDLSLQSDPYLPTDSSAFDLKDIPTLNFFSGAHEDYHRPTDTADKINYEDLERVARLTALALRQIANNPEPPAFVRMERSQQDMGSRDTVRAYTGTIPDYATEVEGLLLGGVMAGGPADKAGLEGGDIIVQFGESTISNIYDYTYALDAVKIDEPLKVVFMRAGERMETTIVPTTRE